MSPSLLALACLAMAVLDAALVAVAWWCRPRGRAPSVRRAAAIALATASGLPLVAGVAWVVGLAGAGLPPAAQPAFIAFVLAAMPEEAFKGLVVWWLGVRGPTPATRYAGAFYGLVAGAALGLLEGAGFVAVGLQLGWGPDVIGYRLLATPLHPMFGAIVGYHLALAAREPARAWLLAARGWLIAVALHGAYDVVLLAEVGAGTAAYQALPAAILAATIAAGGACFAAARRAPGQARR